MRLSEHTLSQKWLAQFRTSNDRALGAQMLNQLKLVSAREFEVGIEEVLTTLQRRLQMTIAVYPIGPPIPNEIAYYDAFTGGIPRNENSQSREIGRRRRFGSEDRVGHVLARLQSRFRRGSGSSSIECTPTLVQLRTQGIRHIVLVDDVCGSGKRITDYWQVIPRRIKSLLSLKRCELWIVFYAITPKGKSTLGKAMPNFPMSHLISILPEADLKVFLTQDLQTLCANYAKIIDMESSGLGYRRSACPVVFEHGCPNNLPVILWASRKDWKGLFPNRSIPTDMRSCFDEDGTERISEALWRANQPKLALNLLDALDHVVPLSAEQRILLMMLGLLLRGIPEANMATRMLMSNSEIKRLLDMAETMGLYDKVTAQPTPMGRAFVSRFRERFSHARRQRIVGTNPDTYYPYQCEGKLRELGKTDRGGRYPWSRSDVVP
ncbi:phosphoribosyltransferase-like protein [Acidithiobacillus sp.]